MRPNCEGYEIVAGQRRYHALVKLSQESEIEPVPCMIMDEGDDAKAIEASLAENVARLPMDEIDQYKAFSALVKEGKSIEEIASQFGITERLVQQRLAIANLINPILTLYRNEDIHRETVRILTMATRRQQKAWLALFKSEDDYVPQGHALKSWLFGGADIPVTNALFEVNEYQGDIVSDLFGEESYFGDAQKFWELQNTAIASAKEQYLAKGWTGVNVLDVGEHWRNWEYCKTPKTKGGEIYIVISHQGEVTFHEGFLTEKQAKQQEKFANGEEVEATTERPELTKVMQNYLDLHRHSAVRAELLSHSNFVLRLAVAQIIAGSDLWSVQADPQNANSDAIKESLASNKAEDDFTVGRALTRRILDMDDDTNDTFVCRKEDWGKSHNLHKIFAELFKLNDEDVMTVLNFVVAETLPCGSAMVEILGSMLNIDMADYWQPDETFFDLLRDKEAINACVKQVAGKVVADAHVSSTAKVQKKIIQDCLNGTRTGKQDWQPRYMDFPFGTYTKRGGIAAIDQWKTAKKHYAA